MKTSFVLTALSTKLAMLVCVSAMGLFGLVPESIAANPSPCHQEVTQIDETQAPCETCETALEAWEENAVATAEAKIAKVKDTGFAVDSVIERFVLELESLAVLYQTYYPPPQVLLKSVTPNTKTIVLLS